MFFNLHTIGYAKALLLRKPLEQRLNLVLQVLLSLSAITLSGCEPAGKTESGDGSLTELSNTGIDFSAGIRTWNDREVVISYELINNSSDELIVLDVSGSLQIERRDDGVIRLFKGKQNTRDTAFDQLPTIEGRPLSRASVIQDTGKRQVPLRLDYALEDTVDPNLSSFEFCIGYAPANVLEPTRLNDGSFVLNEGVQSQTLSCQLLQRPVTLPSDESFILSLDNWSQTLTQVLRTISQPAADTSLLGVHFLDLPERISFTGNTYDVGGYERKDCRDGGHYFVSAADSTPGTVSVIGEECVF